MELARHSFRSISCDLDLGGVEKTWRLPDLSSPRSAWQTSIVGYKIGCTPDLHLARRTIYISADCHDEGASRRVGYRAPLSARLVEPQSLHVVRQRHNPRLGQQSCQFGGDRIVLVRTKSDQDKLGIYRLQALIEASTRLQDGYDMQRRPSRHRLQDEVFEQR